MIPFRGRVLLLDIEGTVSPLAFVREVLFPYARRQVAEFLKANADTQPVAQALEQMAHDAGKAAFAAWCPFAYATSQANEWVTSAVEQLMSVDAKQTGLKGLQGLIWEQGFRNGDLKSVVYPDVPPALAAWTDAGRGVQIYSSGSVHAQKLFFEFTEGGDLTKFLSGYYDTTVGPKRESGSYAAIAGACGLPASEVLFLSDVAEELDAARSAGMATGLALRPGNHPVAKIIHPVFHTLDEIELA